MEDLEFFNQQGYYNLKEIPGRGVCGLFRFLFTVGMCYGLDSFGYEGRYCYPNNVDAVEAINNWSGVEDPKDDNWIKHKGRIEYSNPRNSTIKY